MNGAEDEGPELPGYRPWILVHFALHNSHNIYNVINLIYRLCYIMIMEDRRNPPNIDRRTLALLSNGDILAWGSQELYEFSWAMGIRPLSESDLKPDTLIKKRRSRRLGIDERARGYAQ